MTAFESYARTKVMTSSPVQLRTMLLQRAVVESRQLAEEIGQHNGEGIMRTGGRLRSLLLELMPSESSTVDPSLVSHLRSTGVYLYRTVTDACGSRDLEAADQVVKFLEFELETWQQVVARIDSGASGSIGDHGTNLAG
ncbi:MAG: hypothetical protein CMJ40_05265 [Phycisphaerae bacterium]|nr:hypothetical protein [Phycisphaerae bacterium]|tara:strand:- start:1094 stop:1510 length:417 start_codon:yes stop_codon:yes gene_type:complete